MQWDKLQATLVSRIQMIYLFIKEVREYFEILFYHTFIDEIFNDMNPQIMKDLEHSKKHRES